MWWGPNGSGYTPNQWEAGCYTHDAAAKIVKDAMDGWHPTPDGNDLLPHEVMVREDSFSMITAVATETVLMIGRRR